MDPNLVETLPWEKIVGFALTAAFGLWAWTIKTFGRQHIESMKDLSKELKAMREDINTLKVTTNEHLSDLRSRIKIVETIQKIEDDLQRTS